MTDSDLEGGHSFDTVYQNTENMYGLPYQELQDYFEALPTRGTVLDLGSGQGRDALFLAKLGYHVTAVDASKVGVRQMLKEAERQDLQLEGVVADVLDVKVEKKYDVILFDMILHSFEESQRAELLKKYSSNVAQNGMMCIVFPDDIGTSHFMKLLSTLSQKWGLKDEILVRDIPKLGEEEIDFTFVMIAVQRLGSV